MATRIARMSVSKRRPDDCQAPIRYQVLRVPANGYRGVVCLSHDVVGFDTHYLKRRTGLCLPVNCEGCDAGARIRWYGWIAMSDKGLQKIGIMQFTSGAAGSIDLYFRKHRTLRGALIDFTRIPRVANGRLYASLEQLELAPDQLPKGPDVETIVLNMMGVTREQLIAPAVQGVIELKAPPAAGDNGDERIKHHGPEPRTVLPVAGNERTR